MQIFVENSTKIQAAEPLLSLPECVFVSWHVLSEGKLRTCLVHKLFEEKTQSSVQRELALVSQDVMS